MSSSWPHRSKKHNEWHGYRHFNLIGNKICTISISRLVIFLQKKSPKKTETAQNSKPFTTTKKNRPPVGSWRIRRNLKNNLKTTPHSFTKSVESYDASSSQEGATQAKQSILCYMVIPSHPSQHSGTQKYFRRYIAVHKPNILRASSSLQEVLQRANRCNSCRHPAISQIHKDSLWEPLAEYCVPKEKYWII